MRIIFLDVDGVLNNYQTKEKCNKFTGIDSSLLNNLSYLYNQSNIIEETFIVVSSSWRINYDRENRPHDFLYDYLTFKLSEVGISILDDTPCFNKNDYRRSRRHLEIEQWLVDNKEKYDITNWCILDDEYYLFDNYFTKDLEGYKDACRHRFIDTSIKGLTMIKAKEALRLLDSSEEDIINETFHNIVCTYSSIKDKISKVRFRDEIDKIEINKVFCELGKIHFNIFIINDTDESDEDIKNILFNKSYGYLPLTLVKEDSIPPHYFKIDSDYLNKFEKDDYKAILNDILQSSDY